MKKKEGKLYANKQQIILILLQRIIVFYPIRFIYLEFKHFRNVQTLTVFVI